MPTFQFLEDVRRRSRSGSGHADFSNSKLSKICINQNQLWISEKTIWVLQKVPLKVNEDCPFFGGESHNLIASLSLKENIHIDSGPKVRISKFGPTKKVYHFFGSLGDQSNAKCLLSMIRHSPISHFIRVRWKFLFIAATKLFI